MNTKEIEKAIKFIMQDLEHRELSLDVNADVPLGSMLASCINTHMEVDIETMINDRSSNGDYYDELEHLVHNVTNSVTSTIKQARQYINPLRKELLDKIEQELDALGSNNTTPDIVAVKYPTIMLNDTIKKLLDNTETGISKNIPDGLLSILNELIRTISHQDLIELRKTGIRSLDKEVEEFTSGWLPANGSELTTVNASFLSLPMTLTSFLIVNGLLNERLVDKTGYITTEQRNVTALLILRNNLINRLHNLINVWDNEIANKTLLFWNKYLFSSDMRTKDVIYVHDKRYSKWLTEGGTPEALIGLHISVGNSVFNLQNNTDLINNVDKYVKIYEKQNVINKVTTDKHKTMVINKTCFKFVMDKLTDKLSELDLSISELRTKQLEVKEILRESYRCGSNLDTHVLKLITDIFTDNKDIWTMLTRVDDTLEVDNKGMDVQVALVHSVTTLIANWLYSQIEVVSLNEH